LNASIVDLRYRMKDVLKAIERGEVVTVLYRGKPKARMVPLSRQREARRLSAHEAFGLWRDRDDLRDVAGQVRKLRQGRLRDL